MSKELNYIMKLRQLLNYKSDEFSVSQTDCSLLIRDRSGKIFFQENIEGNSLILPISLLKPYDIINQLNSTSDFNLTVKAEEFLHSDIEVLPDQEIQTYDNHEALFLNFEIFGRRCLVGGAESSRNKFTAHHDDFQRDGGKTTIENISPMLNLEHSAIHILAANSSRDKREIFVYLKTLKEKRKKIESLIEYKKATEIEIYQFHEWLEDKMSAQGYEPCETKKNLMIYKRMETKNKVLKRQ